MLKPAEVVNCGGARVGQMDGPKVGFIIVSESVSVESGFCKKFDRLFSKNKTNKKNMEISISTCLY